jgi:succinate dehydrogenase hydrophobic anchor subunit
MAVENTIEGNVAAPPSGVDPEKASEKSDSSKNGDDTFEKQPLTAIVLLTTTSLMAMFLIALDRTIITTVRNHGRFARGNV